MFTPYALNYYFRKEQSGVKIKQSLYRCFKYIVNNEFVLNMNVNKSVNKVVMC